MATQQEVAQITGLTQQRVQQLQKQQVWQKSDHVIIANRKIIAHLGEVAAGWMSQDGRVDRMREAAMLDRRKREEIELKLAERRGQLISLPSIVELIKYLILAIRTKFLALPSRMRSQCPDLSAKHYAILDRLVRDVILDFNSDRFPPAVRSATEQYFHRLHSAADSEDRPVGGSVSDAQSGE